jgi:hypothetical protein
VQLAFALAEYREDAAGDDAHEVCGRAAIADSAAAALQEGILADHVDRLAIGAGGDGVAGTDQLAWPRGLAIHGDLALQLVQAGGHRVDAGGQRTLQEAHAAACRQQAGGTQSSQELASVHHDLRRMQSR